VSGRMGRNVGAALLSVLALSACAPRVSHPDSAAVEKERANVPDPTPVSLAGTRYQAVPWGRARGLPQNGGYVAAIDEKTGAERWIVKIYDALPADGKEDDKRDVFISRLELDSNPRYLLVTNERHAVFKLDVQTRAVTVVKPRSQ
jgi:hypothetical protein